MAIRLTGSEAHLEGCWTHPAVLKNIGSLDNTLQQIESAGSRRLQINCEQIEAVDMHGLELLYIWIQCARLRGVEPVLVKVPVRLRQVMQHLIGLCFGEPTTEMQFAAV